MNTNRLFNYENKLLVLLSFIFGLALFDRMALSLLVPFFDKELGLNNIQIGLLTSSLSLAWAISGQSTMNPLRSSSSNRAVTHGRRKSGNHSVVEISRVGTLLS